MTTSEMLEAIKPHLWDGTRESTGRVFLCHAAEAALNHHDASVCKRIFMDRLQGYGTLEVWLERKHSIDAHSYSVKARATRLAWLNSLIAEFRAKGD